MDYITVGWATCFDSWETERMVVLPRSKSSKAELCSPDTRGRSLDFSVFSTNQISFPLLWSPISYSLKALTAKVAVALGRTEAVQIFKMPQSWQTGPAASPTTESWCSDALKSQLLTKVVPHVPDFEANLSPHISVPENQGQEKCWVTLWSIWKSDLDYF